MVEEQAAASGDRHDDTAEAGESRHRHACHCGAAFPHWTEAKAMGRRGDRRRHSAAGQINGGRIPTRLRDSGSAPSHRCSVHAARPTGVTMARMTIRRVKRSRFGPTWSTIAVMDKDAGTALFR
jgi:hypothetical protein